MSGKHKWAIVGPGHIARKFADALSRLDDAELVAAASKSAQRAESFAKEYSAKRSYDSYDKLFEDDEVEIVYVATTHNFHCENVIAALESGKHVLCEKPIAVNAEQVRKMSKAARDNGCFLMEAMWTRFLPMICRVRETLASGRIGEPEYMHADFGFKFDYDPQSRVFNPALAGGALLDIGVYTLALASMVMGTPEDVLSSVQMADSGVDIRSSLLLKYENARSASLFIAFDLMTPAQAHIYCTKGSIFLHPRWMTGSKWTITYEDGSAQTRDEETCENGFVYQIMETHRAVEAGKTDSETMPLAESIAIAETMDLIREQWGLRYPFE